MATITDSLRARIAELDAAAADQRDQASTIACEIAAKLIELSRSARTEGARLERLFLEAPIGTLNAKILASEHYRDEAALLRDLLAEHEEGRHGLRTV